MNETRVNFTGFHYIYIGVYISYISYIHTYIHIYIESMLPGATPQHKGKKKKKNIVNCDDDSQKKERKKNKHSSKAYFSHTAMLCYNHVCIIKINSLALGLGPFFLVWFGLDKF